MCPSAARGAPSVCTDNVLFTLSARVGPFVFILTLFIEFLKKYNKNKVDSFRRFFYLYGLTSVVPSHLVRSSVCVAFRGYENKRYNIYFFGRLSTCRLPILIYTGITGLSPAALFYVMLRFCTKLTRFFFLYKSKYTMFS